MCYELEHQLHTVRRLDGGGDLRSGPLDMSLDQLKALIVLGGSGEVPKGNGGQAQGCRDLTQSFSVEGRGRTLFSTLEMELLQAKSGIGSDGTGLRFMTRIREVFSVAQVCSSQLYRFLKSVRVSLDIDKT